MLRKATIIVAKGMLFTENKPDWSKFRVNHHLIHLLIIRIRPLHAVKCGIFLTMGRLPPGAVP
jgi:hypothetical protein